MTSTRNTVRPTELAEAVAALAETTGRVLITGAGTASDWAGTPEPADLLLDTTALTGVIDHNPADMTVAVRAGTPLRELNALLAGHGQRVALDAARERRGATVGGLMATADAGPSALLYGSMRDLVIGATLVLADGTAARTGGHVIKNVAGYDLTKLIHGSYGAYALLAEVVLRLHPMPAAGATVRCACPLARAAVASAEVMATPVEPAAVEWCADALLVRLEGISDEALARRVRRVDELLGGHGPTERLGERDAAAAWAAHAERVDTVPDGGALLRIGCRPSRLPELLARLAAQCSASRATAGLASGVGTAVLPAEPGVVSRAHELVHAAGGTSVLRSRPPGHELPAWGSPPSALPVLRAIKNDLDPSGRLGAGRFAPWMV